MPHSPTHQQQQQEVEVQVEKGFSLQDIKQGIKAAEDLYGIPIQEESEANMSQR